MLVIGGGVIGLSLAWRACERGMSVTVLERDTLGGGTSQVAAGMLAPVAEVEFGEAGRRVLELGLRSAELWPSFAEQLQAAAEIDVGLLRTGTLVLARDEDEARELERQIAFRDGLGLSDEQAARQRGARARAGARAEHAPRAGSAGGPLGRSAGRARGAARGVRSRQASSCASTRTSSGSSRDAGRVTGVTLADGERSPPARSCSRRERGARRSPAPSSTALARAPPFRCARCAASCCACAIRPARGCLSRVIRFEGGYVVPRADGRYVLGATVEERGFDVEPDVGGVYELLREAHEVVPGVSELKIEELCVGLRPGTPDNAPAIGAGSPEG